MNYPHFLLIYEIFIKILKVSFFLQNSFLNLLLMALLYALFKSSRNNFKNKI